MAIRHFRLPDVGEGLTEAEILQWNVAVGDQVTINQVLVEIETAKAAVELPSPFAGVVRELLVDSGRTVDVGTPIIAIETVDAEPDAAPQAPADGRSPKEESKREPVLVGYGVAQAATRRRARKPAAPAPNGAIAQTGPPPAAVSPAAPAEPAAAKPAHVLAKPLVRKLAKDLGVDLATIAPGRPDGVITREEVEHAAARGSATTQAGTQAGAARRIPVKGTRKATAAAVVASAFTAPHVTEFLTLDVTRSMKLVQRLKALPDYADVKISPLLLVAKALLTAIARHPEANASWDEAAQEILVHGTVNLGIAAATPRGLIVPNIKSAERLPLRDLAVALGELTATARSGKATIEDLTGGTITITNVGVFGVDAGTPILNPGEAAILAFGVVRQQPWIHKGRIKPRWITTLSLSFDHRLIDGELGSKLLRDVGRVLEDPVASLL
jgi:2-oxoisovalerate dehydrogenase E2 component (dihydrolipoyl transacylase)